MPNTPAVRALLVFLLSLAAARAIAYAAASGPVKEKTNTKEKDFRLETRLLGDTRWLAGATGALRVIVTDHRTGRALPGARVRMALRDPKLSAVRALFAGVTNDRGTVEASFKIPDLPGQTRRLVVTAEALGEKDTLESEITLARAEQVLLTTDKPLYQPGQTMHLRALALRQPDLAPLAGSKATLEVEDPRGNKVFKKAQAASRFGIVSADFALAREINLGRYTVRASVGKASVEKKVTVERYVLPKFKVSLATDRTFYMPNQTVSGKIQTDYFFGKPVSGGKVRIKFSTFDFQFKDFAEVDGKTDERGFLRFEQKLPDYFVGQPLEQGSALVKIEASVTDGANHEEKVTQTVPVSNQPIKLIAVPESGRLIPGVPNTVYLLASYPDGNPAQADLTITASGERLEATRYMARTNDLGIARFTLTPPLPGGSETAASSARRIRAAGDFGMPGMAVNVGLEIEARDRMGNRAAFSQALSGESSASPILLRTDKAVATVGETMQVEVISTAARGTVYLDVIKDRQTLLTKSLDLNAGQGRMALPLTPDLFGTLEMHAYRLLPDGQIVRDTRLVYVNPARDLNIRVSADKGSYLPGKPARILFGVTDRAGKGLAAALGVSIVDESVYALQEMQPGLEKLYFLLEKELMEPKFEIHSISAPEIILDKRPLLPPKKQEAARVLFASAQQSRQREPFALSLNSFTAKLAKMLLRWQKDLQADYQQAAGAIQRYYAAGNPSLKEKGDIAYLVRKGFLKPSDRLDPWGRPYEFTPCGCGSFQHTLSLYSYGPDGKKNTEDDLWVSGTPGSDKDGQVVGAFDSFALDRRAGLRGPGMMGGGLGGGEPMALFQNRIPAAPAAESEMLSLGSIVNYDANKVTASPEREEVRVRQFFPETLFFNPALITDEQGRASIDLDMADSITTWRLTAFGSGLAGQMGSTTAPLRVFQDFFIDLDLPVALTQNDEVSIPVAVYNYLTGSQAVKLVLEKGDWFEIEDADTKTLEIAPNDVSAIYFRIKVKAIGTHRLTVRAYGSQMSDAVSREIEVAPDGREVREAVNDRLEKTVEKTLVIPKEAIEGASNILVKIYPGIFSQLVEGMDKILQMPFGCFEQTSSTTYPNVLALDYMKRTRKATPEVQMKAEQYINLGYQRLLNFEVKGGGFSWFGDAPANRILTAYGLMEFADMAKVWEVDPALVSRTQQWLLEGQGKDGTWNPDPQYLHEESWGKIQKSELLPTAYIAWALLESGAKGERIEAALTYLKKHHPSAKDAYTLALIANALTVAAPEDPVTLEVLERLADLKTEEADTVHWKSDLSTITYSWGNSAHIETTALAVLACLRAGRYPELVGKALTYLVRSKDASGTWGSTQATVLSLKALIASLEKASEGADATVTVAVNGKEAARFRITSEDADVLRQADCKPFAQPGENTVKITLEGKGNSFYSISSLYYLPWAGKEPPESRPLAIALSYDRTELQKNDILTATASVVYRGPGTANMVILDLGIPPGFDALPEDFDTLVSKKIIQRYSLTGRQVICYFDKIERESPVEFAYRMKARFPIRAKTPKSVAYEYYNPEIRDVTAPVEVVVK
ncbi:MAG: type II secretion system protein GspG [Armatimonadetes bacterium]|nr:type II secretion system protein GspG [Armatimonadota bacterium]